MRFDTEALYDLLPLVYRLRDSELDETARPLHELITLLAGQAVILEDDLSRLYDDEFIETCAPWLVPYIGDLIGLQGVQGPRQHGTTPRAEVANTIGYRRRKGTAAMLEQLARDVTRWPARAVEFFQILATTQYTKHVRPRNQGFVSVRQAGRLECLGTGFEHLPGHADLPHAADVRRISSRRGRYNLPNVGIFLWRLRAYLASRSPAVAVDRAAGHFLFDPLGRDVSLFRAPVTEEEISSLATPANVPVPISRRALAADLEGHYGRGRSILVETRGLASRWVEPAPRPADHIVVADLSEWTYVPARGKVALDPMLGRLAFHPEQVPAEVIVTFHHGFSADLGGGEYDRVRSSGAGLAPNERVANVYVQADPQPQPHESIGAALAALPAAGGCVEIQDSGTYAAPPALDATGLQRAKRVELRAGDKRRPLVKIGGAGLIIAGGEDDEVTLNGLLLTGGAVRVPPGAPGGQGLGRLRLRHCTIVPGNAPCLIVEADITQIEIDHCILGPIRVDEDAHVRIADSIIDAKSATEVAYASHAGGRPGGQLSIENSTVVGEVKAAALDLASNCIFTSPVTALRRQEGCVRYSYVPASSRVPRPFECQPAGGTDASLVSFTSSAYGHPSYMQLSRLTSEAVRRGADDEGEMGAFHHLFQPQKEAYLRARVEEYLRFGLEAGLFLAS